jgi:hypothetical protein
MNGPGGNSWRATLKRLDRLDSKRAGLAMLILAMAAAVVLLLWLERGALFASDEWAWIDLAEKGSFFDLLRPLNQHLSTVPLVFFKALLALWGISFLPFKLAEVVGVLACSGLVYAFSRRRIGPILALAPAMMPLFLGTATSIILQPLIGAQLIYTVVFGLGALLAVEREDRKGDVAACALLCLSVASFSTGLAFLAGVAVAVLLGNNRIRRSYVFVVPLGLYLGVRIWALQFGTAGSPELSNVPILPFYFVDSLAAAATSLFGRESIVGAGPATSLFLQGLSLEQASATLVFATFEVALVVYAARRLRGRGPIPVTLWSTLTILLALWTLQGLVLTEGRTPGENRYLYASALVLVLVVVEFARGVRLSRLGVTLVLAVAVAGVIGNLPRFKEGRDGIVLHSTRARAYTTVMDLAGANANPNFVPAVDAPEVATAGVLYFSVAQYFELASRYDTFAYSLPELMSQDEEVRGGADVIAVDILRLHLKRVRRLPTHGCKNFHTSEGGGYLDLPRGGAIVQSSDATPVALRRVADKLVVPLGKLDRGEPSRLEIPPDRAGIPWKLDVAGPLALTVCRLA